jgi:Pvc16 N-terminal domain
VALVVDVPPNTMLADLDEALRRLLREQLGRHGFDGVEVVFDAPSKEWSGQLTGPTVNLFLYDLREAPAKRVAEWRELRDKGGARDLRPPLILECTYAITAWTQAVEDEHRLLSQLLAILFAYRRIPAELLNGRLGNGAQPFPVEGRIGEQKTEGKADFWNAVGGRYKASLDYVVTLACESGSAFERGPEVRTQTILTRPLDGPAGEVIESHRVAGRALSADGEPIADVWVTLPEAGRWASSDRAGRFVLTRVPAGRHRCVARAVDGRTAEGEVPVPGRGVDLVLGDKAKARKAR